MRLSPAPPPLPSARPSPRPRGHSHTRAPSRCALERASSGELPARLLKVPPRLRRASCPTPRPPPPVRPAHHRRLLSAQAICAEADQSGAAAPNLASIARRWRERTEAAKTFLERLSAPGANIAHTSVESADAAEAEAAALLEGASETVPRSVAHSDPRDLLA